MGPATEPIDVVQAITDLLIESRPPMASEDVAGTIMRVLERYSIRTEGAGEHGLRMCLESLRSKIDQRYMGL